MDAWTMFSYSICIYLVSLGNILLVYGSVWIQWAPTGIIGAHLISVGIWLEHTTDHESLGEELQVLGGELRNQCLLHCGWLASVPDL